MTHHLLFQVQEAREEAKGRELTLRGGRQTLGQIAARLSLDPKRVVLEDT